MITAYRCEFVAGDGAVVDFRRQNVVEELTFTRNRHPEHAEDHAKRDEDNRAEQRKLEDGVAVRQCTRRISEAVPEHCRCHQRDGRHSGVDLIGAELRPCRVQPVDSIFEELEAESDECSEDESVECGANEAWSHGYQQ